MVLCIGSGFSSFMTNLASVLCIYMYMYIHIFMYIVCTMYDMCRMQLECLMSNRGFVSHSN